MNMISGALKMCRPIKNVPRDSFSSNYIVPMKITLTMGKTLQKPLKNSLSGVPRWRTLRKKLETIKTIFSDKIHKVKKDRPAAIPKKKSYIKKTKSFRLCTLNLRVYCKVL